MVPQNHLQLLVLMVSLVSASSGHYTFLMTGPQNKLLEIGTNFTATCTIINTSEVTADDLIWTLDSKVVAKERYIKVNNSALSVTISITKDTPSLLMCLSRKETLYVQMNQSRFRHGIILNKGYRPTKPENVSCIALQKHSVISPSISCKWDVAGRQTREAPISYTLFVRLSTEMFNVTSSTNEAQVTLDVFPNHLIPEIWVEAHNKLGREESKHFSTDANNFVKTNPPSDVQVISEKKFASSLLINWSHPIPKEYLTLMYQVRFCRKGSHNWTYVPLEDIAKDMQSFRLQNLQPDTVYTTQLRCKYYKENQGHWSDWSTNATQGTPQARPSSKPDLWKVVTGTNNRSVQFLIKDPEFANGKITEFVIKIQHPKDKNKNGSSEWETVPVTRPEWDSGSGHRELTFLRKISLPETKSVKIFAAAVNSVGRSPETWLGIPAKVLEQNQVQELKAWPRDGRLHVEWKPPDNLDVTEYVVEWVGGETVDWQREGRNTTHTVILESLEPFVFYRVSVYPMFSGWAGKAASVDAFSEEGVPSQAPEASLLGRPGHKEATVVWEAIPLPDLKGFITHYTLFCRNGNKVQAFKLPGNVTSHTITSLSANTKYEVWVEASTVKGSVNGSRNYFTTGRYAPGEIEGIVVGVSVAFLFVVLLVMLLCIIKKDEIKENFWPQIPNPGESTIGNWSPDYSLKAETPKENGVSGVIVLDVDVCDTKCVFEEDKASLTLKKDKYQSEEHSSGIGGSSCMSSPRQSVSDSDEGGDMADTTASTVQYSSVVASSGYKGQTPSSQAQPAVFSRSESTQPLLDSEENPDVLVQDGSRPLRHFSKPLLFQHGAAVQDAADCQKQMDGERQDAEERLDFCPLEEDGEQEEEATRSGYVPQLGGYRAQ